MLRRTFLIAVSFGFFASAVSAMDETPYARFISEASAKYGVNRNLISAVIEVESRFDPGAVSDKGAMGLMQLMPVTARAMGVDPWDPKKNIFGGTKYLRYLFDAYLKDQPSSGEQKLFYLLAAYHAGQGNVFEKGYLPEKTTREYIPLVRKAFLKRGDGEILVGEGTGVGPEPRCFLDEIQIAGSDTRATFEVGDTLRIKIVAKNTKSTATQGALVVGFPRAFFEVLPSPASGGNVESNTEAGVNLLTLNMPGPWPAGRTEIREIDVRLLKAGEASFSYRFSLTDANATVSYPYCCGEWLDASGYPAKMHRLHIGDRASP